MVSWPCYLWACGKAVQGSTKWPELMEDEVAYFLAARKQ
jgi:hypothetical protein